MLHPRPDEAIHQIVAELAALHAGDIAAILDALNAEERPMVEALLRDYLGRFEESLSSSPSAFAFDPSHVSSWLLRLLQSDAQSDIALTPLARQTLHDCAVKLYPLPVLSDRHAT